MRRFQAFFEQVAEGWCYWLHPAPMWPIHGYYECRRCHRRRRVAWEEPAVY